jgi:hypothetical protein
VKKWKNFKKACLFYDGAVEYIVEKLWKTFKNCGKPLKKEK